MTADFARISESKRAHRARLASLPIGEKLRLLDELRERELAIRGGAPRSESAPGRVREQSEPYDPKSE